MSTGIATSLLLASLLEAVVSRRTKAPNSQVWKRLGTERWADLQTVDRTGGHAGYTVEGSGQ